MKHHEFRIQSDDVKLDNQRQFDELVVGDWLHVERLGDRCYYVLVGDIRINVYVRRNGTAETVIVEQPK